MNSSSVLHVSSCVIHSFALPMFAITQVHESVGLSTKDSVNKAASTPVLRVFGLQMKTL